MTKENWLEKIIKEFKEQNPDLGEDEINSVSKLVFSVDMQDKELRQAELTQHAQSLLKNFLDNDKTDIKIKHES